ncbi:MAG: hypothetical protein QOH71_1725 [Blastocatellia bacterium]|jgi:hypothetical protein|nr:hypothetical protein [Blastocatellia bacterium]
MISDWNESRLISLSVALGARKVEGWTTVEEHLCTKLPTVDAAVARSIRDQIVAGEDPLGDLFCRLRSPAERRPLGATYTPHKIVETMVAWAEAVAQPTRVVDPGVGSARFLLQAGRSFEQAQLIGSELDPVAAIIARANLAAAGYVDRSKVILGDYRDLRLQPESGRTLYIGNVPYVRHHLISRARKEWLTARAAELGLRASQLAGLHVHFFLSTVLAARPGDFGAFITAAEWLDVNYGQFVRELFLGPLGGQAILIIEPEAMPFPDANTTAAITSFQVGSKPKSVRVKRIKALRDLPGANLGLAVSRETLKKAARWSSLTQRPKHAPAGFVELGELCRVHRGQVTGANKIWIAGEHSKELPPSFLFPTVTKARELIAAGLVLRDTSKLRRVIDIPLELDELGCAERRAIDRFLRWARKVGAGDSFIAKNRKAWWAVGLRQPAPILATYMARRPPAFVRNIASARHINIAHGLYPREQFDESILNELVRFLSLYTSTSDGRTYAGGLTKFEPREMERILVPEPQLLVSWAA